MPNSDSYLNEEKDALMRQGLLHAGMAMLGTGGQGFGGALANGIESGLLAMNQGADNLDERRYKQQLLDNQVAGPAGWREFQMMAKAAGLKEGSPEFQQAANIALGREGRASNAASQSIEADIGGVPTRLTFNPRTGTYERAVVPEMPGADPVAGPLAGAVPPTIGVLDPSAAQSAIGTNFPGARITSGFRTPEQNAALPNSVPNSYHLTGEAMDIAAQSPEQAGQIKQWAQSNGWRVVDNYRDGHIHIEPPRRGMTTNPL